MKVLVVDDDRDTTTLLAMLLERQGYAVDVAESVTDAAEALSSESYDVLITDLHLGDGLGTSLLELRGSKPVDTAFLITGAGEDEEHRTAKRLGFDQCMTKPIDVEVITQRIRVLDTERRQRA